MKLQKKDQKLLLCAGGVMLALLAYLFVFRTFSEKNGALKNQNLQLSEQVRQLESLDANKEQYIADAEEMNLKVDEIINQYPAEIRNETAVMYAYELENEASIHFSTMTINPKNLLYTTGQYQLDTGSTAAAGTTDAAAADANATNTADGDAAVVTGEGPTRYLSVVALDVDYTVTYQGFKDAIEAIQSDLERRNVESVALSYDSESGNLLGTMVINLFELQGVDKEYEAPNIPSVPTGNTNPFGSTDTLQAAGTVQDLEGTEGAEGAEGTEGEQETAKEE